MGMHTVLKRGVLAASVGHECSSCLFRGGALQGNLTYVIWRHDVLRNHCACCGDMACSGWRVAPRWVVVCLKPRHSNSIGLSAVDCCFGPGGRLGPTTLLIWVVFFSKHRHSNPVGQSAKDCCF